MREEGVIYSNVRPQQRRRRPETRQSKDISSPSPWKIVAVILWIICLILLLSVGVLAAKLNQNLFQAEEYPTNISSDEAENETVWECPICPVNWHQYGENCYHVSRKELRWKECSQHCIGSGSSFLRLDIEEEMNFVKNLSKMECGLEQENFWISLYYNNKKLIWVWLDGTALTLDKLQLPENENVSNKCMLIKYGQIIAEDCQNTGYCICKKTPYSNVFKYSY
ncbi:natural killer cells antigen CD94 isoform X1 [Oryctolagus cuniculus]|uniref:natural killer cells antigen CD94 isoform X1 n=1 Tax=Oryctolagus cuniculus TaxID=9986 RepID=UPI0038790956